MNPVIDELIRTRRKSIALEVRPDARLIVRAPQRVPFRDIREFVSDKQTWIREKQEIFRTKQEEAGPRDFSERCEFLFLGTKYKLQIIDGAIFPLVFDDGFILSENYREKARDLFIAWYKDRAAEVFPQRAARLAAYSNLYFNQLSISDARTQWGSCSNRGNIHFSWRLVMAPPEVIDYIIIHELVHIEIKNHGSDFRSRVQSLLPDWKEREQWLSNHIHLMDF